MKSSTYVPSFSRRRFVERLWFVVAWLNFPGAVGGRPQLQASLTRSAHGSNG